MEAEQRLIRPPQISLHRGYDRAEPGFALTGYLHHIRFAIWTCYCAIERWSEVPIAAEHNRALLNNAFVRCRTKFRPYILQWHAEMVKTAKRVRVLPAAMSVMEKTESALGELWDSTAGLKIVERESLVAGDEAVTRSLPRSNSGTLSPSLHLDASPIQLKLAAAWEAGEHLLRFWPQFDPAKQRVDLAVDPWEQFYRIAIDLNDHMNEGIYKSRPESPERYQVISKASDMIRALEAQWSIAIKHALTDELASLMNAGCLRVRDAANACLANSVILRPGQAWAVVWGEHNDAVLALQNLTPLLQRAVRARRAGTPPISQVPKAKQQAQALASVALPPPPTPPPGSLPLPDPWMDKTRSAGWRLTQYRLHLTSHGRSTRLTSPELAALLNIPEQTIRRSSAWKAWGVVEPGGGLADQHRKDRGRDSGRAEHDRIEQEGDDDAD